MNLRTEITRRLIRSALLKEMKEKPVSRITVKDLCLRAEISRPTFYQYYRDVYDLADQTETEFITALTQAIGQTPAFRKADRARIYKSFCALCLENRDLFLCFYGPNGDPAFIHKIIDNAPASQTGLKTSYDLHYSLSFLYHGTAAIIYEWLLKEEDRETPEQIANVIIHLTFEGISQKYLR